MKLASIPTAVKVGGAGVLGGGGIAGTGLLINNQVQKSKTTSSEQAEIASNKGSEDIYKLMDLDKELITETEASIVFSTDATKGKFAIGGENNKEVSVTVIASSTKVNGNFATNSNKWACIVKGFVKDTNLELENSPKNFDIDYQKTLFTNNFSSKKEGFVKSCSRNRTDEQRKSTSPLTSEIKVELKKPASETKTNEYGFQSDDLNKIFSGDWVNPSNP